MQVNFDLDDLFLASDASFGCHRRNKNMITSRRTNDFRSAGQSPSNPNQGPSFTRYSEFVQPPRCDCSRSGHELGDLKVSYLTNGASHYALGELTREINCTARDGDDAENRGRERGVGGARGWLAAIACGGFVAWGDDEKE